MEYYSVIKKREILPFAMTWMKLKGIMLSETSDRDKTVWFHVSMESNTTELIDTENRMVVTRGLGDG